MWQFSLRHSLGIDFLYKETELRYEVKMLCPHLCYLGAFLDRCCLVANQRGLNLSLQKFLIVCILCLVGILMEFNKALGSEKPDWPGAVVFPCLSLFVIVLTDFLYYKH